MFYLLAIALAFFAIILFLSSPSSDQVKFGKLNDHFMKLDDVTLLKIFNKISAEEKSSSFTHWEGQIKEVKASGFNPSEMFSLHLIEEMNSVVYKPLEKDKRLITNLIGELKTFSTSSLKNNRSRLQKLHWLLNKKWHYNDIEIDAQFMDIINKAS
jgi:hypothetical protein